MSGAGDELPAELPAELRELITALSATGLPVSVTVVKLPARSSSPAPRPMSAEECPLPHTPCPACSAPMCFGSNNEASLTGACGSCGSLVVTVREPLPRAVRLMTDEEFMALPDDERLTLRRSQELLAQAIAARTGGKH